MRYQDAGPGDHLNDTITNLWRMVEAKDARNRDLRDQVRVQKDRVEELEYLYDELDSNCSDYQAEIARLKVQVEALRSLAEARLDHFELMGREAESLRTRIKNLENRNEEQYKMIRAAVAALKAGNDAWYAGTVAIDILEGRIL